MFKLLALAGLGAGAFFAWRRLGAGRTDRKPAEPEEMYDSAALHQAEA